MSSSTKIPRAFAPKADGASTPVLLSRPRGPPKVVLPPKRQEEEQRPSAAAIAATAAAPSPPRATPRAQAAQQAPQLSATELATPKAPPEKKREPQPSPKVRTQALERGMIVAYEEQLGAPDASIGVVDSVFAAINEVWIIPEDAEDTTVRCSTSQVKFLGTWSKTLEIINSIDVPADLEAILGPDQMEQVQDLAKDVPCHLESLPPDAAPDAGPAQLIFGPAPAKDVKLAVEAVVGQVDGLEFPTPAQPTDATSLGLDPMASAMAWMPSMGMSNVPMMMVPVWSGTQWSGMGWSMAGVPWEEDQGQGEFQPEGHDAFPDAFPDASWAATFADPDPAEPAEPAENGGAVPPWRSQELPPPPKRVSSLATNNATVRVKRFRRAQPTQPTQLTQPTQPTEPTEPTARVKEEIEPESKSSAPATAAGVKAEQESSLLYWAKRQHQFKELPKLPQGWIRVPSRQSSEIYYVNLSTGEATFDSPLDLPPGWEVVTSKSTGKQYFWHAELQISQFERPT